MKDFYEIQIEPQLNPIDYEWRRLKGYGWPILVDEHMSSDRFMIASVVDGNIRIVRVMNIKCEDSDEDR